jgi:hypothetical protein
MADAEENITNGAAYPPPPPPPPPRMSCSACGFTAPAPEYRHVCMVPIATLAIAVVFLVALLL